MNIEKMLAECRAHWEKTKPDAVFADYWIGWQASRESLVIELPSEDDTRCDTVAEIAKQESYNLALGECAHAIEAAGLKVKS